jgi:hypothetical protein
MEYEYIGCISVVLLCVIQNLRAVYFRPTLNRVDTETHKDLWLAWSSLLWYFLRRHVASKYEITIIYIDYYYRVHWYEPGFNSIQIYTLLLLRHFLVVIWPSHQPVYRDLLSIALPNFHPPQLCKIKNLLPKQHTHQLQKIIFTWH